MNSKEYLRNFCFNCEKNLSDKGILCPFRSISNEYCNGYDIIKQDLDRLEKLEKVFSDLKSMFEINIGIDCGNEYFIEIKQSDSRISELIPQEDIKTFKEVLCDEK